MNPQNFPDVPTVAQCWDTCFAAGPTTYASYKASNGKLLCTCFNSFAGKPTNCGAGDTYVWQYGPNVVVSGVSRRRRAAAAAQKALSEELAPHCPLGLSACRVAPDIVEEGSYECINPLAELESCGGCVFGEMGSGNATGVE